MSILNKLCTRCTNRIVRDLGGCTIYIPKRRSSDPLRGITMRRQWMSISAIAVKDRSDRP